MNTYSEIDASRNMKSVSLPTLGLGVVAVAATTACVTMQVSLPPPLPPLPKPFASAGSERRSLALAPSIGEGRRDGASSGPCAGA